MRKSKTNATAAYIVLIIAAVLFILPFIWLIFASFDSNATLIIKLPKVTLNNFEYVFTNQQILVSFLNGFLISFGQAVIVVVFSVLAAYPLSRYKFKAKKPLMFSLLFLMGLPIIAVIVPVYQLFFFLKFTNSLLATTVFMASTGFPLAIWLMKNFMDSIPIEVEEAAWVDGASKFKSLKSVIAPLMLPGICMVFIFIFTGGWGNFFVPFILLNSPDKMVPSVTIYQFFAQYGFISYGKLAAFSLVYTLPPIVLFYVAQKHISSGFRMGGASKQ
ncbi:MAG TPA: carbohydrate ABC transporter permease [Victivallales bacterium]|nr:carbohydrate ABC transporter permease [Victivallales bacterium]